MEKNYKNNDQNKLSDEELENVSGAWKIADWIDSTLTYKSGDKPKFEQGMMVSFRRGIDSAGGAIVRTGKIIKVSSTACGGIINKEFLYDIMVNGTNGDENFMDYGVYESCIYRAI